MQSTLHAPRKQANKEKIIICRYGELFLKGENRHYFIRILTKTIKEFMKKEEVEGSLVALRARLLIRTTMPNKFSFLRRVFGLVSYSIAFPVSATLEDMASETERIISPLKFSTFAIAAKRITKKIPQSSVDINIRVGSHIQQALQKKVDLTSPDITVGIDIIDDKAYIFTNKVQCAGGLPVGSTGRIAVLCNHPDAELAALLMMKRGCTPSLIVLQGEEFDVSLLQAYLPTPVVMRSGFLTPSSISDIMCSLRADALVTSSSDMLEDIHLNGISVLCPLVGLSNDEKRAHAMTFKKHTLP